MSDERSAADDDHHGRHTSLWLSSTPQTDYPPLDAADRFDTVVVGGGIAGIATAYGLHEAGQDVALVERGRISEAVTGHTTAKLTSLHGLRYDHLADHFGERGAREYATANEAAIDRVESLSTSLDIDCDFARTPAYTYVTSADDRGKIRNEVDAARRVGLPASFVESTPLPYDVEAAVRFDDQARFHPRAFLLGLAEEFVDDGGHLFERTTVREVTDGSPCRVRTDRGNLQADDVVLATHFPIVDPALYFARLWPKRSYIVAARLADDPPEGMYYDPSDPYFSVRPHPTDDPSMVLIGGENHRPGATGSESRRYERLERRARDRFDVESFETRWSTQDFGSVDRVPFVGRLAPHRRHLWVATGFGGWGMTNGIAAGDRLRDLILGREQPRRSVFRPARLQLGASVRKLASNTAHTGGHFVGDRVRKGMDIDVDQLAPGDGKVIKHDGDHVAVSRDADGTLRAHSAVCPHMGCLVDWNDAEHTWDCPCHGSRYDAEGSVVDTPAIEGLKPYDSLLRDDDSPGE